MEPSKGARPAGGLTPYRVVVWLSVGLIGIGALLIFQPWSQGLYQVGFLAFVAGALLQIIMGQLGKGASAVEALKMLLIGAVTFGVVVGAALFLAPRLTRLL